MLFHRVEWIFNINYYAVARRLSKLFVKYQWTLLANLRNLILMAQNFDKLWIKLATKTCAHTMIIYWPRFVLELLTISMFVKFCLLFSFDIRPFYYFCLCKITTFKNKTNVRVVKFLKMIKSDQSCWYFFEKL